MIYGFTNVSAPGGDLVQSADLEPTAINEVESRENLTAISKIENQAILPLPAVDAGVIPADIDMLSAAKNDAKLRDIIARIGPKSAMAELLNDSGGGALVDCHQESHNIGRIAYEVFGAIAFADGNAACHSGYYHGAIESFLYKNGTANLVQNIKTICDSFGTSFGRFECLHGIGHGVMAYENYDLPGAIKICASLENDYDRSSCYGGMFMENIVTAQGSGAGAVHETEWANKSDPYFPCESIGGGYDLRYQCYQMQTSWMLTIFNYDFDRVKDACLEAPTDMRLVCFKSFGRDAAGHTLRDVDKITAICVKVSYHDEYYKECVNGAVNVIIDFWGDGLKDQATNLCKTVLESGKLTCYQTLSWRLGDVFGSTENRADICAGFEDSYRYLCAN